MEAVSKIAEIVSGSIFLALGALAAVIAFNYVLSFVFMPRVLNYIEKRSRIDRQDIDWTGHSARARWWLLRLLVIEDKLKVAAKVSVKANQWLTIIAGVGGVIGLLVAFLKRSELWSSFLKLSSANWYGTQAWAQAGARTELTGILPYIATFILVLMGAAFVAALFTLLTIKDTKENQARIKAADNVVKTFGGFFTGLATTLIH